MSYTRSENNSSDEVHIKAHDGVELTSLGKECVVTSVYRGIEVEACVGTASVLKAHEDIIINGYDDTCLALGNNTRLTSETGKIQISGRVSGDDVELKASGSIRLRDVGKNARIESEQNDVSLRNVGIGAVITARETIKIGGSCPEPASLTLRSMTGKETQWNDAHVSKFSVFSPAVGAAAILEEKSTQQNTH